MHRFMVAGLATVLMLIVSPTASRSNPDYDETVEPAPVAVQHVSTMPSGLRDEAAMVLVGAGLLVLAAAVRRSA